MRARPLSPAASRLPSSYTRSESAFERRQSRSVRAARAPRLRYSTSHRLALVDRISPDSASNAKTGPIRSGHSHGAAIRHEAAGENIEVKRQQQHMRDCRHQKMWKSRGQSAQHTNAGYDDAAAFLPVKPDNYLPARAQCIQRSGDHGVRVRYMVNYTDRDDQIVCSFRGNFVSRPVEKHHPVCIVREIALEHLESGRRLYRRTLSLQPARAFSQYAPSRCRSPQRASLPGPPA